MPPQRLSAAYITNLLNREGGKGDDDAGERGRGRESSALEYLTEVRGLNTRTLRKYGVGSAYYDFPSRGDVSQSGSNGSGSGSGSGGGWEKAECVTFPWIMRASDVSDQEGLRGGRIHKGSDEIGRASLPLCCAQGK